MSSSSTNPQPRDDDALLPQHDDDYNNANNNTTQETNNNKDAEIDVIDVDAEEEEENDDDHSSHSRDPDQVQEQKNDEDYQVDDNNNDDDDGQASATSSSSISQASTIECSDVEGDDADDGGDDENGQSENENEDAAEKENNTLNEEENHVDDVSCDNVDEGEQEELINDEEFQNQRQQAEDQLFIREQTLFSTSTGSNIVASIAIDVNDVVATNNNQQQQNHHHHQQHDHEIESVFRDADAISPATIQSDATTHAHFLSRKQIIVYGLAIRALVDVFFSTSKQQLGLRRSELADKITDQLSLTSAVMERAEVNRILMILKHGNFLLWLTQEGANNNHNNNDDVDDDAAAGGAGSSSTSGQFMVVNPFYRCLVEFWKPASSSQRFSSYVEFVPAKLRSASLVNEATVMEYYQAVEHYQFTDSEKGLWKNELFVDPKNCVPFMEIMEINSNSSNEDASSLSSSSRMNLLFEDIKELCHGGSRYIRETDLMLRLKMLSKRWNNNNATDNNNSDQDLEVMNLLNTLVQSGKVARYRASYKNLETQQVHYATSSSSNSNTNTNIFLNIPSLATPEAFAKTYSKPLSQETQDIITFSLLPFREDVNRILNQHQILPLAYLMSCLYDRGWTNKQVARRLLSELHRGRNQLLLFSARVSVTSYPKAVLPSCPHSNFFVAKNSPTSRQTYNMLLHGNNLAQASAATARGTDNTAAAGGDSKNANNNSTTTSTTTTTLTYGSQLTRDERRFLRAAAEFLPGNGIQKGGLCNDDNRINAWLGHWNTKKMRQVCESLLSKRFLMSRKVTESPGYTNNYVMIPRRELALQIPRDGSLSTAVNNNTNNTTTPLDPDAAPTAPQAKKATSSASSPSKTMMSSSTNEDNDDGGVTSATKKDNTPQLLKVDGQSVLYLPPLSREAAFYRLVEPRIGETTPVDESGILSKLKLLFKSRDTSLPKQVIDSMVRLRYIARINVINRKTNKKLPHLFLMKASRRPHLVIGYPPVNILQKNQIEKEAALNAAAAAKKSTAAAASSSSSITTPAKDLSSSFRQPSTTSTVNTSMNIATTTATTGQQQQQQQQQQSVHSRLSTIISQTPLGRVLNPRELDLMVEMTIQVQQAPQSDVRPDPANRSSKVLRDKYLASCVTRSFTTAQYTGVLNSLIRKGLIERPREYNGFLRVSKTLFKQMGGLPSVAGTRRERSPPQQQQQQQQQSATSATPTPPPPTHQSQTQTQKSQRKFEAPKGFFAPPPASTSSGGTRSSERPSQQQQQSQPFFTAPPVPRANAPTPPQQQQQFTEPPPKSTQERQQEQYPPAAPPQNDYQYYHAPPPPPSQAPVPNQQHQYQAPAGFYAPPPPVPPQQQQPYHQQYQQPQQQQQFIEPPRFDQLVPPPPSTTPPPVHQYHQHQQQQQQQVLYDAQGRPVVVYSQPPPSTAANNSEYTFIAPPPPAAASATPPPQHQQQQQHHDQSGNATANKNNNNNNNPNSHNISNNNNNNSTVGGATTSSGNSGASSPHAKQQQQQRSSNTTGSSGSSSKRTPLHLPPPALIRNGQLVKRPNPHRLLFAPPPIRKFPQQK